MNCEESMRLIEAHIDGELDIAHELEIEEHIQSCEACARENRSLLSLRQAIAGVPRYEAPADLLDGIRPPSARKIIRFPIQWPLAIAAALLLTMGIVKLWFPSPAQRDNLASELIDNHIRSLMAAHLADVISTDQHTVKPWFNGRLDFSPPVIDLATDGFPLTGGRLDYAAGRPVAALVYGRNKHIINVFIWPAQQSLGSHDTATQGYNLIEWSAAGMNFATVSDLNPTDLHQFTTFLRQHLPAGTALETH